MKNPIYLNVYSGVAIEALAAELAAVKSWGFDGIELGLYAFPLIISGKINKPFVSLLKNILKENNIRGSAHIGTGLDLRSKDSLGLHVKVLNASVEICAELGLNPLILHYEKNSGDPDTETQFFNCHAAAAEFALQSKVKLGLENIEIEHYKPVLDTVRQINHPNLGMVLDTGHLFLASGYYGFSFEDAVKECAPFIFHCHLNDNSGIFEKMRLQNFDLYRTLPMGYRIAFGRGDIHMPPLYSETPIPYVIGELKKTGFAGIYVCEYSHRMFTPLNAEICGNVRKLAES
ncbi:MAG: sugar phosphate isomerase/epimerase [Treponema sp.]|nr:sugar phosphate isomerase/epimerase [Treponema sp.]